MADAVRTAYCIAVRQWEFVLTGKHSDYGQRYMPQWDGGVQQSRRDRASIRYPIWPKIGDWCIAHQVPPSLLMDVVFGQWRGAEPPWPTHLMSERVREKVKEALANAAQDVANELRFNHQRLMVAIDQQQRLDPRLSNAEAMHRALLHDGNTLSAVYRVCLAHRSRLPDVMQKYWDVALCAYVTFRKHYNSSWGNWIPSDFIAAARDWARLLGDTE